MYSNSSGGFEFLLGLMRSDVSRSGAGMRFIPCAHRAATRGGQGVSAWRPSAVGSNGPGARVRPALLSIGSRRPAMIGEGGILLRRRLRRRSPRCVWPRCGHPLWVRIPQEQGFPSLPLTANGQPAMIGEGGIRTHGTRRYTGFRDRPIQPLWHLSRVQRNSTFCRACRDFASVFVGCRGVRPPSAEVRPVHRGDPARAGLGRANGRARR